jgi:hypothetical protein
MTSTILVVTERDIEKNQLNVIKASGMDVVDWRGAQGIKPSDYEVVILDTRIAARTKEQLAYYRSFFVGMRPEIEILLRAGGVVFVLAGPSIPISIDRTDILETNYDFLPEALLKETGLSTSESRIGARYESGTEWTQYFSYVPNYCKTIQIEAGEERGPHISYFLGDGRVIEKVRILALTTVTSEVVACIISWQQGDVIIAPPPVDMFLGLLFLKDRGAELYKENVESLGENVKTPAWIEKYRSLENQRLEEEESKLTAELQTVRKQLKPFFVASASLYSIGKGLEKAVTKIFSDFDWNVDDRTKTGEPIDYIIKRKSEPSKSLVVALTGTTGYIDSKSGKLAQLLGAFPEVGTDGRLVFLINGSVETDPTSRTIANYITDEALKRLAKNDVCVLLVFDLYRLWMDYLDKKRTANQVFELIHTTAGLFKYGPI